MKVLLVVKIYQMVIFMGMLIINCGIFFIFFNFDLLCLVLILEVVYICFFLCNLYKYLYFLILIYECVLNSEEFEYNDVVMEVLVDINSQGIGNLDDCDVLFDGDEFDGNDIIEDGRVEVFEYECC